MDGGKFDGNTVAFVNALACGIFTDGVNGLNVVVVVAVGILFGVCGFTQHIEREAVTHFLTLFTVLQRFFNGLTGYELFAQQAHGVVHTLTDQRGAAFADQTAQCGTHLFVVCRGQFAGNQQTPCSRVNEEGRAIVQVAFPVAFRDFVGNQAVTGCIIRNTQQGFGQTHQCNTFFTGERELVHQGIYAACFGAAGADLSNQTTGKLGGGIAFFVGHLCTLQHILNGLDFIAAVGISYSLTQRSLCWKSEVKHYLCSPKVFSWFQTA